MEAGKELTTQGSDRGLALMELETRFAMAVRQRELLEQYIRERLKADKHFYTVGDEPGRKPSLTKEGAELICLPHNLKPRYAIVSGPESPPMDDAPFQITVNCELMSGDKFGGQGLGSANSMITKKDGSRVQRQKDPGLRHNATLKMACKSAYIAATLNATAASEFFTQDLEDDQNASPEQAGKGHWCSVHKCAFFKKGKMASFAHPIGDTGKWCHEPSAEPPPEATKPPAESKDTTEVTQPPPAPTATKETKSPAGIPLTAKAVYDKVKIVLDREILSKDEMAKVITADFGGQGAAFFEAIKSLPLNKLIALDAYLDEKLKEAANVPF